MKICIVIVLADLMVFLLCPEGSSTSLWFQLDALTIRLHSQPYTLETNSFEKVDQNPGKKLQECIIIVLADLIVFLLLPSRK